MKQKLFCFGLGYSAQYLIQQLKQQKTQWAFSATRRNIPKDPIAGVDYHIFNSIKPLSCAQENLSEVTHMLISIPPESDMGDPVLYHHKDILPNLKKLKWIGYLSTTGVYGDRNGNWVDDNSTPTPTSLRGHQRADAEQGWLDLFYDHNIPCHIFRLGSIYGPNKGPLANFNKGRAVKIVKKGQYFSRIHVADIAQTLIKSMEQPDPGQTYNVVDDMPASTHDVMDYICTLLGVDPLLEVDYQEAAMSPLMKIFYSENKRVRNDRIKQELKVNLKYPTYKQGFKALAQDILNH